VTKSSSGLKTALNGSSLSWDCVIAGAIVVPIDYHTSLRFLRHIRDIVDAHLILIGEEVRFTAWEGQPLVWALGDLAWTTTSLEFPQVQIAREDVVEIVFTSGATGEPKGVLITHGNILANMVSPSQIVSAYRKWFLPLLPLLPLRFLTLIPLSHMFGQALAIFILPLIQVEEAVRAL
jgi:long-chain acyl-CoA synthetase